MTWLFSLSRFLVSRILSCFVVKVLGLVVFALVANKCKKVRVLDLIESEVADDEVDWISCFPEGETTHLESLCFDCVESPINFKALEGIVLRSPFLKKLRTNRLVSSVIRVISDVFSELKEHEKKITEILEEEEASFCKSFEKGIEKFQKAAQLGQENTLSGERHASK
ncbi:unnamed protein product [Eruca vesicaria subsp. sativa]|uniref:Alanyl-tRNA synthetase class IIc N-terminal domain-containing protein n=1 Tax=Eruca vesicaria subsp. sativa TaxID=29727 RepID=A0ABC8KR75_ERUVS|nr:unnamed protein product [Eruca vesicaria subsp. sativa]